MKQLLIVLPLPPRELSPNARPHWRAKAQATKQLRRASMVIAIASVGCKRLLWNAASIQLRYFFRQNMRRDKDNYLAMMKAAFDGLADAGVVKNDSGITHEPVIFDKDTANPRVEMLIRCLDK